jgi:hypothetical protein
VERSGGDLRVGQGSCERGKLALARSVVAAGHGRAVAPEQDGVVPSGGDHLEARRGLQRGDEWLALEGGGWDLVHVNFGLHDLKRVDPETGRNSNDPGDPPQAAPEVYERQLEELLERLVATGARVVFASTTPVPEGPLRPHREPQDAVLYNELARGVARRLGLPVNDLHAFVLAQEPPILRAGDVHFDERGSRLLGERVAAVVLAVAAGEAVPGVVGVRPLDQAPQGTAR